MSPLWETTSPCRNSSKRGPIQDDSASPVLTAR
jgi:hypothetical protein